MWPEIFRLELGGFSLPLRSFGFFVALGFLIGVQVAGRLSRRYGTDPENELQKVPEVSWSVLLGVILGARLAYVLVNIGHFSAHPVEILKIWEGGLVMYGGLILALFMGIRKARKLGMNVWRTADYFLVAGFLGQAIGRLGCLSVGDDYGRPLERAADGSAPWFAITFPDPLPFGSAFPPELAGIPVHPTQLYMAAKALLLFVFGLWLLRRKRFDGQVMALLMMGYAGLRFLIEYFRYDAEARGGIFRAGASPADTHVRLHELGVATADGRITDFAAYRRLIAEGAEGIHPQLLLSTSQMAAIATFVVALFIYRRLRGQQSPPLPTDG